MGLRKEMGLSPGPGVGALVTQHLGEPECWTVGQANFLWSSLPPCISPTFQDRGAGNGGGLDCGADEKAKKLGYYKKVSVLSGLPWGLSGKESACQCRRPEIDP